MANVSEAAGSYTLKGEWSQAMIDSINIVKNELRKGEYYTDFESDFEKNEPIVAFQGNGRWTYSNNLLFASDWIKRIASEDVFAVYKTLCNNMEKNGAYIEVEYTDCETGGMVLYEETAKIHGKDGDLAYEVIEHKNYEYTVENLDKLDYEWRKDELEKELLSEKRDELKQKFGGDYQFTAEVSPDELRMYAKTPESYERSLGYPFVLAVGDVCVNIDANDNELSYLFETKGGDGLWRYNSQSTENTVNLDVEDIELEMLRVLDEYVQERGFSYGEPGNMKGGINPMTFNTMINKIMPDVENGSTEPLMIYRDKDGGWHGDYTQNQYGEVFDWVEDVKEQDPFAVTITGDDLAGGSFPYVYDRILNERLRAEYSNSDFMNADLEELRAIIHLLEENIGEFSSEATDYLTTLDKPLFTLYEMTSISLKSNAPDFDYDYDKIGEFVDAVETEVAKRLANREKLTETDPELKAILDDINEFFACDYTADDVVHEFVENDSRFAEIRDLADITPGDKKRFAFGLIERLDTYVARNLNNREQQENVKTEVVLQADSVEIKVYPNDYSELQSQQINGRLISLSENPQAEYRYMVCEYNWMNPLGLKETAFTGITNDYIEALEKYTDTVKYYVACAASTRDVRNSLHGVEHCVLTEKECVPGGLDGSLEGKVIIIKSEALSPQYQTADYQLRICSGGFGAVPDSRGRAVFCTDLFEDKSSRFEREDVLGVAEISRLPEWARNRIAELQSPEKTVEPPQKAKPTTRKLTIEEKLEQGKEKVRQADKAKENQAKKPKNHNKGVDD